MDKLKLSLITPEDDFALAELIRYNLASHDLALPGTVYFDENLYHLSDFYLQKDKKRFYYILKDEKGEVVGGIGLAELDFMENCAELQKLYLADSVKGLGLGYKLIELIEEKAREFGYNRMYLETHTKLAAAIHIYEKSGYKLIEKPEGVVHGAMNRFYLKDL